MIAAKYGAPVYLKSIQISMLNYSSDPPITPTLPDCPFLKVWFIGGIKRENDFKTESMRDVGTLGIQKNATARIQY